MAMNVAVRDASLSHSIFTFDKLPAELRVHIRSYLKDDTQTLSKAIRVNKEWFHELVSYLWREIESSALPHFTKDNGRLQFYADNIRTLVLDCSDYPHEFYDLSDVDSETEDLIFVPAGRTDNGHAHWSEVLPTFSTPYLEKLRIEGGLPPDHIFCLVPEKVDQAEEPFLVNENSIEK